MKGKVTAKKKTAREIMLQGKAKRNKRFDKITGTCVPKGEKLTPLIWEELTGMNNVIFKALAETRGEIDKIVKDPRISERIKGHESESEFNNAYNTFNKDGLVFLEDLEKLRESHSHLKGVVTTQEELDKYYQYYEEYSAIQSNFLLLAQPNASLIALIASSLLNKDDIKVKDETVKDIKSVLDKNISNEKEVN